MDIERVNENTIKLYITYRDIEDRGYSREEIWYNRAKGEELFWDMIGEINTEEYFDLEGPIWIHVNASEQGLEVVVTRASFNADIEPLEDLEELDEDSFDVVGDALFDMIKKSTKEEQKVNTDISVFKLKEIEELIPVADRLVCEDLNTSLYQMENMYYLVIKFDEFFEEKERKDITSIASEYLTKSIVTIHRLEEHGKKIMDGACLETIHHYFK